MGFLKEKLKIIDATDKSGIKNMLLKPISMVLSLVYTPLLLSYLGDEKYGLWATILSIISWINYCDVGIGHGLRNLLTKELTDKQYESAQKSVSTAYIILGLISLVILIILIVLVFTLDLHTIFNTKIDMQLPVLISCIFIVINFVLALSNTILYALQLSEHVALRSCLVQVLNIIGLLLLNKFTSSSLVLMAILFGVTSTIVYIINIVHIAVRWRYLSPKFNKFDKSKISAISNVGIRFFIIQISCLLLYSVSDILITHFWGGAEVTPFNVVNKAFNMGFSVLSALTVPYWSRTTEALQRNDIAWIKRAIKKMYVVCALACVAYIVLAIIFKPLAALWIGKELDYQPGIIWVMCVYYILFSFVTVNTPFINGTGKINGQLIVSTGMGILNIPLSIFLGVNCNLGVVGIRLATTILMAIGAVFYPLNLFHILKKEEKENIKVNIIK